MRRILLLAVCLTICWRSFASMASSASRSSSVDELTLTDESEDSLTEVMEELRPEDMDEIIIDTNAKIMKDSMTKLGSEAHQELLELLDIKRQIGDSGLAINPPELPKAVMTDLAVNDFRFCRQRKGFATLQPQIDCLDAREGLQYLGNLHENALKVVHGWQDRKKVNLDTVVFKMSRDKDGVFRADPRDYGVYGKNTRLIVDEVDHHEPYAVVAPLTQPLESIPEGNESAEDEESSVSEDDSSLNSEESGSPDEADIVAEPVFQPRARRMSDPIGRQKSAKLVQRKDSIKLAQKREKESDLVVEDFEEQDDHIRELEEELGLALKTDFALSVELGKGGFKTVYAGTYKRKSVAIAVISTKREGERYLSDSEIRSIESEIELTEAIRETQINGHHYCRPYIPRLIARYKKEVEIESSFLFIPLGSSRYVERYYIIMEKAAGDMHNDVLSGVARLPALGAAIQMLIGVRCVHEAGYIHKDIKPLNFLKLNSATGALKAVWTNDFGLAVKKDDRSGLSTRAGTKKYMPPRPETAADGLEKYDMYLLGKSFEQLGLATHLPLNTIAQRMIADRVDDRDTPQEFLERLATLILSPLTTRITTSTETVERLRTAYQTAEENAAKATQKKLELDEALRARPLPMDLERAKTTVARYKAEIESIDEAITANADKLRKLGQLAAGVERKIREATESSTSAEARLRRHSSLVESLRPQLAKAQADIETARKLPVDTRWKIEKWLKRPKAPGTFKPREIAAEVARTTAIAEALARQLHDAEAAVAEATETRRQSSFILAAETRTLAEYRKLIEAAMAKEAERPSLERRRAAAHTEFVKAGELLKTLNDIKSKAQLAEQQYGRQRDLLAAAIRTKEEAKEQLDAAEATLAKLKESKEVLEARLTLRRTPDDVIAKMMNNEALF